jgi:hypothetical protein
LTFRRWQASHARFTAVVILDVEMSVEEEGVSLRESKAVGDQNIGTVPGDTELPSGTLQGRGSLEQSNRSGINVQRAKCLVAGSSSRTNVWSDVLVGRQSGRRRIHRKGRMEPVLNRRKNVVLPGSSHMPNFHFSLERALSPIEVYSLLVSVWFVVMDGNKDNHREDAPMLD